MISSHTPTNILFWSIYVLLVAISAEVYGYFWHRLGAHSGYVPGIKETHEIHHLLKLSDKHEANEDFVWILLLIITLQIILGLAVTVGIIPGLLAIVTILTLTGVFIWNWWIHQSFHVDDHWLNQYEWFKHQKNIHYVHHNNPSMNYGVATHFCDKLFGTWTNPK